MSRMLVGAAAALVIAFSIPLAEEDGPYVDGLLDLWEPRQAVPAASAVTTTYDDFMRLDAKQRQDRFRQLGPEDKAMVVRTHAQRWLAKNRTRLDSSEVAVFQEAIAFVTPDIYSKPLDPSLLKQQQEVTANFRCRVNPDDVSAAFDVLGTFTAQPGSARWSYLSRAKCWIGWFAESVVEWLPTVPKSSR